MTVLQLATWRKKAREIGRDENHEIFERDEKKEGELADANAETL
jgi:hypothetical protein